jgi:phosphate transport system permease protein
MATETVVRPKAKVRVGDRVFSISTVAAGSLILLVLAAVAIFLIAQSIPAFTAPAGSLPGDATSFWAYVGPLVFGTVWSAVIALVIALPLSIAIALFISHYAPRRIAMALGYVVDLLAAVPSVVFGLWGATVLAPMVQPFYLFLNVNIGWFPLFGGQASGTGKTILTASVVLAVMVIPIITAVCREIFLQAPRLHEEAPGIVSAAMLGLGRALGETLAVAMVLSPATVVSFLLLTSQNSNTIAANIALQFPEASGVGVNVLVASGLILFVITLVVNSVARVIVNRRKAFSGAN